MKYRIVLIVVMILLPFFCPAQEIEASSQRHKVTLRIQEEWSDEVSTNLYTAVSRKEYFLQSGSYNYFYLNPDIAWEITDRIKWYTGFRSKFTFYDELDLDGLSKDFTSLLAKTNFTLKPVDKLKMIPSFQSVFDLYQNEAKTQTTQTFGLSITSTIDNVRVGGRYKGILRSSLGEESAVPLRFNNEFGVNVNWDPNK